MCPVQVFAQTLRNELRNELRSLIIKSELLGAIYLGSILIETLLESWNDLFKQTY
jgi:hypothetical protein